jgi:uncharacterized protein (DUF2252 family)
MAPSTTATPPVPERAQRGKQARKVAPRSSHGAWNASGDRAEALELLRRQDETRVPELVPIRWQRMLSSPFAFFRGAAALMAADLEGTPSSGLPAQLCGDAHLSNFGGFAAPDRDLVFDINDFDETLPGPWEWDLKRLLASLAVAGRERGLSRPDRRQVLLETAGEYRRAMRSFAGMRNLDLWYARLDLDEIAKRWGPRASKPRIERFRKRTAKARSKDSLRALSRLARKEDGALRIVDDPPLIVPLRSWKGTEAEPAEERIRALLAAYGETLSGAGRSLLDGYSYVDLARKVVGVGSVGTRSLIVLMLGRDEGDPLFLQVKEAGPSVLEPYAGKSRYRNHGRRVIEGQWLIQAASDVLLGWVTAIGVDGVRRDFYVRQLWDAKMSAEVEALSASELVIYGEMCGWTLARAHARSCDRVALAAYLGSGDVLDRAMTDFAEAYADQNERDHELAVARYGSLAADGAA